MEWLANITVKWVLVAVGVLAVVLAAVRVAIPDRRRDSGAASTIENLQVVLSVVVVVFLLIRPFLFQAFFIPSGSMEPTLLGPPEVNGVVAGSGGDRLLVNKWLYRVSNPQRGDIVVFKAPPHASIEEKEFIKRVIAVPGESIRVVPPQLVVDGKALLKFSTEPNSEVMQVTAESLPAKLEDGGVNLTVRVDSLKTYSVKIIVHPEPRIFADGYNVRVNGRSELDDGQGAIREEGTVAQFGGDPGVPARVFSLHGDTRLIVVQGREFAYQEGYAEVNGQRLVEPYLKEDPRYAMESRRLGANEYFMMGDNRNHSNDSHAWGPLTRDRVIGRAEVIFWPLNRLGVIQWALLGSLAVLFVIYQLVQRMFAPAER